MRNGLAGSWVSGLRRLEDAKDVLGAGGRPEGEKAMVLIREAATPTDGHETEIRGCGKDHAELVTQSRDIPPQPLQKLDCPR
jgi:hypothetical protein